MSIAVQFTERALAPNPLNQRGIRGMPHRRLARGNAREEKTHSDLRQFVAQMAHAPVALAIDTANAQNYEVSTAFYRRLATQFQC